MNASHKTKVVIGENKWTIFVCPNCSFLSVQDITQYAPDKPVQMQCKCGHHYTVFLERRKYYRKAAALPGICTKVSYNLPITVVDLSLTGLRFRTDKTHNLSVGDELYVEFTLNDKPNSVIVKKVIVKSIDGSNVHVEFTDPKQYSKILPYLYFE